MAWTLRTLKAALRSSVRNPTSIAMLVLAILAGAALAYLLVHLVRRWRHEGYKQKDASECTGRGKLLLRDPYNDDKCITTSYCDEIKGHDVNGRCMCWPGATWDTNKNRCLGSSGGAAAVPEPIKNKYWTCTKNGQSVGSVVLGWAGGKQFTKGITGADALGACNYGEQAPAACAGNSCKAMESNIAAWRGDNEKKKSANEPTDHAIIAYNNEGVVHKVYPNNGPKDNPYDKGINDTKAGGIKAVWVPKNMKLCLKNRRGGRDDKYTLSGGTEGNGKLYTENIPAKNDADDAWLITGTQSC